MESLPVVQTNPYPTRHELAQPDASINNNGFLLLIGWVHDSCDYDYSFLTKKKYSRLHGNIFNCIELQTGLTTK